MIILGVIALIGIGVAGCAIFKKTKSSEAFLFWNNLLTNMRWAVDENKNIVKSFLKIKSQ